MGQIYLYVDKIGNTTSFPGITRALFLMKYMGLTLGIKGKMVLYNEEEKQTYLDKASEQLIN